MRTMRKPRTVKRILPTLATVAGLVALGVGAAGGATAAPVGAANPGIPPGSTGSLTIHEYLQPVESRPSSEGMALPPSAVEGLTPLPGATFKVQQVPNVDLTKNSGWVAAEKVVKKFDPFSPEKTVEGGTAAALTQTTNSKGEALFSSLPVGLYLVQQVGFAPVAENQQMTMSMPFLITVPMTDPSTVDSWVYNLHVYPKNTFSEVTKTVDDAEVNAVGETISYGIETTIPGGKVTTKYVVRDALDPKLKFKGATVEIAGTPTQDFTVQHKDGVVEVDLGATARGQAFQALKTDASSTVKTTITATVLASGEIDNDATLTFSRGGEVETQVPGNLVTAKFGGLKVKKEATSGQALKGATFEVRQAHTSSFEAAKTIAVDGVSTWTSGANGEVTIDGLRYSGFAEGQAVSEDSGKYNFYWLVETKAPQGFELLTEPIPFVVDAQVGTAKVLTVTNVPHNAGGTLPKTGANGSVAALGGGLLVAGFAAMLLARRVAKGTDTL